MRHLSGVASNLDLTCARQLRVPPPLLSERLSGPNDLDPAAFHLLAVLLDARTFGSLADISDALR